MRILLITPPYVQCNTPYAATPYLYSFLKQHNKDVAQTDASLLLLLRVFSRQGIEKILQNLPAKSKNRSVRYFRQNYDAYHAAIAPVVRFLQGKDPSLAYRITSPGFLPHGPRFSVMNEYAATYPDGMQTLFGTMGIHDLAQHCASLFIDDIMDVIVHGIDAHFGIERYGSFVSSRFHDFSLIEKKLDALSLIDEFIDQIAGELLITHNPSLVGLTIPFAGCLYPALRLAYAMKRHASSIKIAIGGGYVSTELRRLSEPRLFNYVDFVCLDDGMQPVLAIIDFLEGKKSAEHLCRTFVRKNRSVHYYSQSSKTDIPFIEWPAPGYEGLELNNYLPLTEMANPMHRLWNSQRWNKMIVAHGCYWHKCRFCDTSLEYIRKFETVPVAQLVENIKTIISRTGCTGFHFVDEAIPPALLIKLAQELIRQRIVISWWGNIRFEKAFTAKTVSMLAQSGCIAVTGGIEAVSDRLLALIDKGISFKQMAQVTKRFADAGIMVHAYLMYGVPSCNLQEAVDALERVRQLFINGCIHSAYWHRFSATIHSHIGQNPDEFGIVLKPFPKNCFAQNDIVFEYTQGVDPALIEDGLNKALYNYMHGIALDEKVGTWFPFHAPKPGVPKNQVAFFIQ